MLIIKGFLCLFWLLVVPAMLGMLVSSFQKEEKNSILYDLLLGYIINFAIFEIIAVFLTVTEQRFTMLVEIYSFGISMLIFLSIIFIFKKFYKYKKDINVNKVIENIKKIKIRNISFLSILVIIMIGFQIYMVVAYAHVNNDDSEFIGSATAMIETDSMYMHSMGGEIRETSNLRRVFSPISAYFALISNLVKIQPAIVAHSILPGVFVILAFIVYYYLGKKLFDNKKSIYIFLIILSLLFMNINSHLVHNYYFLLYTWFGRTILSAIIIPFIWLRLFNCMDKENKLIDWIILLAGVLAGCAVTSNAIPLIPTMIGLYSLICSIRDKKIDYIFKSMVCVLPCVILGVCYLLIK